MPCRKPVSCLQPQDDLEREYTFVVGARDPEMREIARVLKDDRRRYVHAAREGAPVAARTAYEADGVVHAPRAGRALPALLPPQAPAVFVAGARIYHSSARSADPRRAGGAASLSPTSDAPVRQRESKLHPCSPLCVRDYCLHA